MEKWMKVYDHINGLRPFWLETRGILLLQNHRLLFVLARADLFPEGFFFLLPVLPEGGAEKASGGERKSLRGSTLKPFGWNVLMPISRRLQLC
jgi:hypothetical protein